MEMTAELVQSMVFLCLSFLGNEKVMIRFSLKVCEGLPQWLIGKEAACNARDIGSIPGSGDPLEKEMATYSSILAWKSHGQRSLVGYSRWGCKELDTIEHAHHAFPFQKPGPSH